MEESILKELLNKVNRNGIDLNDITVTESDYLLENGYAIVRTIMRNIKGGKYSSELFNSVKFRRLNISAKGKEKLNELSKQLIK